MSQESPLMDEDLIPLFEPGADPGRSFRSEVASPTLASVSGATLTRWSVVTLQASADAAMQPTAPTAESPYILRGIIGRGGMGEIWEAEQTSLRRTVAIKRIREDRLRSPEANILTSEFHREARITARLEHPNIVPVHDLGIEASGEPLLSMKLVQGTPWHRQLQDDLEKMPALDYLGKHLPVLVDMAQAVAFAHSKGVVHRDLKPAQVVIGEFGEVVLMDWGLAIYVGDPAQRDSPAGAKVVELTTPDTASNPAGTPNMMAPEQTLPNANGIGTWTDVYLLGGTLYLLLTGTYPHAAPTALAAMQVAERGEIEDPRERARGRVVPEELAELTLRALAKNPAERVPSAQEFIAGVQEYISGSRRRRESEELVARARKELPAAAGDYGRLSDVLAVLAQATSLWPDNPAITPTQGAALHAYADSALRSDDLTLARVQAKRHPEPAARGQLLEQISVKARQVAARERQRRTLVIGAVVLLLAVLAGALVSNREIRRREEFAREQQARAEAGRKRATAAHEAATTFISDLMLQFAPQLTPSDPRDRELIARLGPALIRYTDTLQVDEPDFDAVSQQLRLLTGMCIALFDLGYPEDAKRYLLLAMDITRRQRLLEPRTRTRMANTHAIQLGRHGMHAEAEQLHRETEQFLLAIPDRDALDERNLFTVRSTLVIAAFESGNTQRARELLELMEPVYQSGVTRGDSVEVTYLEILATMADQDGNHALALELQETAFARDSKIQGSNVTDRIRLLGNLAFLLHAVGDNKGADAFFAMQDTILREGLGNRWSGAVHKYLILRGRVYLARGEFERAIMFLEMLRTSIQETGGDERPEGTETLQWLVRALGESDRIEEAAELVRCVRDEAALGVRPAHPSTIASMIRHLAKACYARDRFAESIEWITQVLDGTVRVAQYPPDQEQHDRMLLGVCRFQLGELEGAEEQLRIAAELCRRIYPPTHHQYDSAVSAHAKSLIRLGRHEEARPLVLERWEHRSPDRRLFEVYAREAGIELPPR